LETHDPPQSADAPCQPFVNLPFAYVLFDSWELKRWLR
jgi:hypothetical protein